MEVLSKKHIWRARHYNLQASSSRWKHELGALGETPVYLKVPVILFCHGIHFLSICFSKSPFCYSEIAPNMGNLVPLGSLHLDKLYKYLLFRAFFLWMLEWLVLSFMLHFMSFISTSCSLKGNLANTGNFLNMRFLNASKAVNKLRQIWRWLTPHFWSLSHVFLIPITP